MEGSEPGGPGISEDRPERRSRRRYFLAGLVTVIPLGVTLFVLIYLVKLLALIGKYPAHFLASSLKGLFPDAASVLESGWFINSVAVLMVVLLVYFIGMMTTNFLGRQILALFEWVMQRIPLVKTVYGAVKKLVDLLRRDDATGEVQRVVLIDFPSPEMKTVGLVTRTFQDHVTGRRLAAVYVPTTPNPTSGYLEIVPVERITSTNWSFDEAMAFVVSGGAVAPGQMNYDQSAAGGGEPQKQTKGQGS
ncbi:MAG: DUF502 domain-containing protein [Verrucomicrobiota bacterium]